MQTCVGWEVVTMIIADTCLTLFGSGSKNEFEWKQGNLKQTWAVSTPPAMNQSLFERHIVEATIGEDINVDRRFQRLGVL